MPNIFSKIQSSDIAAYYTSTPDQEPPFLGPELFPVQKQLGMELSYIKGSNNTPVALNPSNFDVKVIPRGREGFAEVKNDMPFYKESKYIDEKTRQKLLLVQSTNNPAYQDVIINHIFADQAKLIKSAAVSREIAAMQALTTGKAIVSGNGVSHTYDYFMPDGNKVTATVAWDQKGSNPIKDIKDGKTYISRHTGATLSRAVMNQTTWDTLVANDTLKSTILANNANTSTAILLDSQVQAFMTANTGIQYVVYDKGYKDALGAFHQYIPDGTVVLMPQGNMGNTYFGTTPEEADLMGMNNVGNVSLVDTGVAITTMPHDDPVNVEIKVSQLTLPSFEMADSVYVLSGVVTPLADDGGTHASTSGTANSGGSAASGATSEAPKA